MDLTDLNNWPDGAEACINGRFIKWVNGIEHYFLTNSESWKASSISWSICEYESKARDIKMRPQESDKWKEGEERMNKVDSTLDERGSRYGEFSDVSDTTQAIKNIIASGENADKLNAYQIEALDMIASKIARIVNGDPDYIDNWHDISGYARLVEIELEK